MAAVRMTILALVLSASGIAASAGPAGRVPTPTLNSGGLQLFTVGDPATLIGKMTVIDGSPALITTVSGFKIIIPPALSMTWDPSSVPAFSGSAALKMNPGVVLSGGNRVATFSVNTNFLAGDRVNIDGMKGENFLVRSLPAKLGLDWTRDAVPDVDDFFTKGVGAPTLQSAADQVFRSNDPATPVGAMTITDDAAMPRIVAAKGLRIRIPAAFGMKFDASVTSATFGGTAAAKVLPTVTYEDGDKTLAIDVATSFTAGDTLVVSGLFLTTFTLSAASHLELETSDQNTVADLDNAFITVAAPPTIASASSQVFTVNDPPTAISTITYSEGSVPAATPAAGIRITIPSAAEMTWDAADTAATFGGTASGKVSGTVSYSNLDRTLMIVVTTAFGAGDTLTIDGLSFANFTAGSAGASLTLECDADGAIDATDAATKSIGAPTMFSGASQVFQVGDPATAMSPVTVADGAIPRITAVNGIRLRIPAGFPMTWSVTDTTATISGSASSKVSTSVTYEDADRTAVLTVTSDFVAGEGVLVSGLSFANFSAGAPAAHLELEVNHLGTAAAADLNSVSVFDPAAPVPVVPSPPYDPGGSTGSGTCGLLGMEVVAVLGLLKGLRRRRS